MMKEIRIHGRGGQGVVTAAEIIAIAAFADGKYSQAFPTFGSERMGAPVAGFVRISDAEIRFHNQVYEPNYVIVQDSTLIGAVDVTAGFKKGGILILNSEKIPDGLKVDGTIKIVPATKIALEILKRPIPNTVLLGAFAAITKEISLDAVLKAIDERFAPALAEKNKEAAKKTYTMFS
ncbi:MAG: pyruvate ferredoxin oxidoreductase subunit gamma [Candidatus Firestonebacteria bacterium]